MSKFNNPDRALAPPRPPRLAPLPPLPEPLPPPVANGNPLTAIENGPANEAPLVSIGFTIFCVFLISGMLNDWALLLFGGKAYLSAVMVLVTPAVWLVSGNSLRGFRDTLGIWWLLLLGCMLTSIPFSYWKGSSVALILSYVSRSYCFFFYVTAFVTSLKNCRRLMLVNIAVAVMTLISCAKFGYADMSSDGRFQIPGSMFIGNSNDLALQLTIGLVEFVFLFYLTGVTKRLVGLAGVLGCLFYMLKTGSRGSVLALMIAAAAAFILSKQKAKMALIFVPVVLVALFFIPQSAARRLLLTFRLVPSASMTSAEASAMESQAQRQELIQKSVTLTLQHPLFGVGMGQFVIAAMGEAAKKGEWAAALGTHNSYTQVSSECGIPALICYLAILCVCFRRSYRLYQLAALNPQFSEVEGLAFSLFLATLVYAVATFFFHIAYSGLLPMISGEIMALYTIAHPVLIGAKVGGSRFASSMAAPRFAASFH